MFLFGLNWGCVLDCSLFPSKRNTEGLPPLTLHAVHAQFELRVRVRVRVTVLVGNTQPRSKYIVPCLICPITFAMQPAQKTKNSPGRRWPSSERGRSGSSA